MGLQPGVNTPMRASVREPRGMAAGSVYPDQGNEQARA